VDTELTSERLLAIIQTQNDIVATALDLEAVMAFVVERAQSLSGADAAVLELAEGDEMVYHVAKGAAGPYVGLRLSFDASLSGMCVRDGRIMHCADARVDDRVDYDACALVGAMSMVCVPLVHGEKTVGVLKVYDARPNAFSEADIDTLSLLSGVIGAHMAHASDFEVHRHDSRHDALTGLLNRRAFEERLAEELSRSTRHGLQFALCLLDLDRFKQVNDTRGHAAGDAVLKAIGRQLVGVRAEDAAYRLGGDEFALVLVGASAEDARAATGRLTGAIAGDPACQRIGTSWGSAIFEPGDDVASLTDRADAALYDAKRPLVH
jgi:diguanylate cyclase (GGDEF)-like protein